MAHSISTPNMASVNYRHFKFVYTLEKAGKLRTNLVSNLYGILAQLAQLQITFYDFSIEFFTAVNVVEKCEYSLSNAHANVWYYVH